MNKKLLLAGAGFSLLGLGMGFGIHSTVVADTSSSTDRDTYGMMGNMMEERMSENYGDILTEDQLNAVVDRMEENRLERNERSEDAKANMENVTRTVEKTDDGIVITLSSDNAETIEWMHGVYDEHDGEFPDMMQREMGHRPGPGLL